MKMNRFIYALLQTFFTKKSFQATPELTGVAAWTRAGNSRPTCHIPITVEATHPWRKRHGLSSPGSASLLYLAASGGSWRLMTFTWDTGCKQSEVSGEQRFNQQTSEL